MNELQSWPSHGILHVKRDWNQSADQLASTPLHQQGGIESTTSEERPGLETINRLLDLLILPEPLDQNICGNLVVVSY